MWVVAHQAEDDRQAAMDGRMQFMRRMRISRVIEALTMLRLHGTPPALVLVGVSGGG